MVHTHGKPGAPRCKKCNSTHVDIVEDNVQICLDCGYEEKIKTQELPQNS